MKLPKRVKIAGYWYKVRFPYRFKKSENVLGQCDYNKKEIKIADTDTVGKKMDRQTIEYIFIHEINHAINFHYNYCKVRERGVCSLSEGWYQVLKDNPKLF